MLLFLIPHLKDLFQVTLPEMAFVVTATGLAKVVGTIGWGWAADKFGRKLPFMVAILWFSFFCGLSGLAGATCRSSSSASCSARGLAASGRFRPRF